MEKKAEVRTTPEGYELRVNGVWNPSSLKEIDKLLHQGWMVLWNRKDYRFTARGMEYVD